MGLPNNLGKLSNMITSTGSLVGVGTTNPKALFEVGGTAGTNIAINSEIAPVISNNAYYAGGGWKYRYSGFGTYLNLSSDGSINFATAPSGTADAAISWTERLKITNGGNVGIGASSITNGTTFGGGGQVNRLKVASGNYTCLEVNGNTSGGSLQFTYGTDLPNQVGALIAYNYASGGDLGMYISNVTNGIISFATNNTERMRITSGGNVGIGTNSPLYRTHIITANNVDGLVVSTNANDAETGLYIRPNHTNGTITLSASGNTNKTFVFNTGNTERLRITSGGQLQITQGGNSFSDGLRLFNTSFNNWGIVSGGDNNLYFGYNSNSSSRIETSGAYVQLSDINKKKDFEESTIGLIAILGLKPTLFRMKTDDESSEKQLGFIAQEVKDCIPQAYSQSDEFIGLNYNPIVAALVKAIQELNAKVTALENK